LLGVQRRDHNSGSVQPGDPGWRRAAHQHSARPRGAATFDSSGTKWLGLATVRYLRAPDAGSTSGPAPNASGGTTATNAHSRNTGCPASSAPGATRPRTHHRDGDASIACHESARIHRTNAGTTVHASRSGRSASGLTVHASHRFPPGLIGAPVRAVGADKPSKPAPPPSPCSRGSCSRSSSYAGWRVPGGRRWRRASPAQPVSLQGSQPARQETRARARVRHHYLPSRQTRRRASRRDSETAL